MLAHVLGSPPSPPLNANIIGRPLGVRVVTPPPKIRPLINEPLFLPYNLCLTRISTPLLAPHPCATIPTIELAGRIPTLPWIVPVAWVLV